MQMHKIVEKPKFKLKVSNFARLPVGLYAVSRKFLALQNPGFGKARSTRVAIALNI